MGTRNGGGRVEIGSKLRECREYLGYSQDEVAESVGLSRSAISLIESGERKVDVLELKQFAELYQRPIDFFTGDLVAGRARDEPVTALFRRVTNLTESDKAELMRFVEFLESRKEVRKRR